MRWSWGRSSDVVGEDSWSWCLRWHVVRTMAPWILASRFLICSSPLSLVSKVDDRCPPLFICSLTYVMCLICIHFCYFYLERNYGHFTATTAARWGPMPLPQPLPSFEGVECLLQWFSLIHIHVGVLRLGGKKFPIAELKHIICMLDLK
jgi:hypothetical protein